MPANDPNGLRFGEVADAYDRGRPEYPSAVVDWLLATHPTRVLDLGAGTGKLTAALVHRASEVFAVEPSSGMRQRLSVRVPRALVLPGTAEQIPLPDSSVDAVLVAQAWHWVDPVRAVPEVARVLAPDGVLGLVWNDRDEDDPWIAGLTSLLNEYGTSPDSDYEPVVGSPFRPLEEFEWPWTNHVTPETVVDMIVSRSYVIALDEARRAELVARLREHIAQGTASETGMVPVRYVTRAYRTRVDRPTSP